MRKKRRIGCLPRSSNGYVATIRQWLNNIEQQNPSVTQFSDWIQKQFSSIKSRRVVEEKIRILQHLELIATSEDQLLLLSEIGENLLRTRDNSIVFEQLEKVYAGFTEIMDLLKNKPALLADIQFYLKNKINIDWKTETQVNIRMRWLQELGYVTKKGKYYCLTQKSKGISCKKNKQTNIKRSDLHKKIAEEIADMGRMIGRISEKEYEIENYRLDVVWKECGEGYPAAVFEIQVDGILEKAISRLKSAYFIFGNPLLFLITDLDQIDEAKKLIRITSPDFVDIITVAYWEDLYEVKKDYNLVDNKSKKMGFRGLRFQLRSKKFVNFSEVYD